MIGSAGSTASADERTDHGWRDAGRPRSRGWPGELFASTGGAVHGRCRSRRPADGRFPAPSQTRPSRPVSFRPSTRAPAPLAARSPTRRSASSISPPTNGSASGRFVADSCGSSSGPDASPCSCQPMPAPLSAGRFPGRKVSRKISRSTRLLRLRRRLPGATGLQKGLRTLGEISASNPVVIASRRRSNPCRRARRRHGLLFVASLLAMTVAGCLN